MSDKDLNHATTMRQWSGPVLERLALFARQLKFRWRALLSRLIALRLGQAGGRIYFGSDCLLQGAQYIRCRGNFIALDRNRIEAIDFHHGVQYQPSIAFGHGVTMEYGCHIGAVHRIEIHDHVLIASNVYISDHSHGEIRLADLQLPPNQRRVVSKGPVIIESHVWLGEGVAVLPGVRIGHHSVIGAHTVVTRDIPPYSVATGVPVRVIRTIN